MYKNYEDYEGNHKTRVDEYALNTCWKYFNER